MVRDIHNEVSEQYFKPYLTGEGTPALLPKVMVGSTYLKLTPKLASSLLSRRGKALWYRYPAVRPDYYDGRILKGRNTPARVHIALRVGDKWITNRGNETDKFSIVGLKTAKKMVGKGLRGFDYAIINWYNDSLPTFLLGEDNFNLFSMNEVSKYELSSHQIAVANLIKGMASNG